MSRPPRLKQFTYVGLHSYFLTSCTYQRQRWFEDAKYVDLVLSQILRTSLEQDVAVDAYCIMPDHLHGLMRGRTPAADLTRFMRLAKQRSGVRFHRLTGHRLWQEGYYDRLMRNDDDRRRVMAYIVNNPILAGLVDSPEEYPFWGSFSHSRQEILNVIGGRLTNERRRHPRYRLDAEISVNDRRGRSVDISSSGVFFESPIGFTPGEEVVLVLPFQESGPTRVECRAKVLRVETRGTMYGVAATYEPTAFSIPR